MTASGRTSLHEWEGWFEQPTASRVKWVLFSTGPGGVNTEYSTSRPLHRTTQRTGHFCLIFALNVPRTTRATNEFRQRAPSYPSLTPLDRGAVHCRISFDVSSCKTKVLHRADHAYETHPVLQSLKFPQIPAGPAAAAAAAAGVALAKQANHVGHAHGPWRPQGPGGTF